MKKIKLMTIVGTRPEIIKLSETIKKCDRYFDHILVHTGQNYDYSLNNVFFDDLEIREPDYFLEVVGENLGITIGNIIAKSYQLMDTLKPEALLVLGDTNSCLSVISAKRLKIPVFHLEAGNRCFDENLPEEVNRRIVDHTSDVNLCYTEHARNYLNWEGFAKERTYVVGSPISEVIIKNMSKIENSTILNDLSLKKKQYILLSAHREENIDIEKNFYELVNTINTLATKYGYPIIYSLHPRSKKMISKRNIVFHENVIALSPFNFSDYLQLQRNALCVVSDSGTIAEEASFFKFPAVSIRTSTERPEALDKGNFIIGGITEKSVLQSIEMAIKFDDEDLLGSNVANYVEDNFSLKVVKIIQSYVDIINRTVWKK